MKESIILPDFPRTQHLPYKANAAKNDTIANESEVKIIFESELVEITEKVDGANTGMCFYEGNPIIRNRNHILNKSFTNRKTSAKMQFASIFGYFYNHIDKFDKLNNEIGFEASVYGEWMYATHGIHYDLLPSIWISYDIYDWQKNRFLPPPIAREALQKCGFCVVPILKQGKVKSYEELASLTQVNSKFSSSEKIEGIYVKVFDAKSMTNRFKMVRPGFIQGCQWSKYKITKNKIDKTISN